MAKVLGVKWMSLRLFTNGMDQSVADLFSCRRKSFPDKRNPMFFPDGSERIMAARAVERPRAIHEHFLDQMLPAPEKQVGHFAVVLDHTAKLLFYAVTPVFEDLLELIKHDRHIPVVFRRDLRGRLQDFVQGGGEPGMSGNSEVHFRLSFPVDRD